MPFRRKTTTCAGMCSQSFKINRRGRLQWAGRGGGGPSRRSQPGPRSRDCEGAGGADSPGPVVRSQNRVAHPAFRGLELGIRRNSFHGKCLRDEAGAARISPQLSSIQPFRTIVYRPPPRMQDEPNSNLPHFRRKGARGSGAGTRAAGPAPGRPESHPTIRLRGRSSSVSRAKIQMNHNMVVPGAA